jgi:hypothetical protein
MRNIAMSDIDEHYLLAERIDHIERTCWRLNRQNRWLKACAIVLPLIALAVGAGSQTKDLDARSVTAERLVIKDAQGRKRVTIECKEKRASCEMYDPTGARRISLNVMDNGFASIYQQYGDGRAPSFGWVTPADGAKGPASFALRGPDGAVYATMTGKTTTSPPSFEVFSGDKDQNTVLGKLGGSAQ